MASWTIIFASFGQAMAPSAGSSRPARSSSREDGKPAQILGTIRDVTERKVALEKLSSSEERFRRVAETSPNACICTDESGQVTFWNRGAQNTFGYSAAEMVGRSIEAVVPGFQPANRKDLRAQHQRTTSKAEISSSRACTATAASFPWRARFRPGWKVGDASSEH